MTALPPDVVADLSRLIAELEQRLESSFAAHDGAIAQQAARRRKTPGCESELRAARDREAASADILRTISELSGDAERSLPQIAEITARLFGASSVTDPDSPRTVNGHARSVSAAARRRIAARPFPIAKARRRRPEPAGHRGRREPPDSHSRSRQYRSRHGRLAGLAARARGRRPNHFRNAAAARGQGDRRPRSIHRDRLAARSPTGRTGSCSRPFADQAVDRDRECAAVQRDEARTEDLTESWQQQTATVRQSSSVDQPVRRRTSRRCSTRCVENADATVQGATLRRPHTFEGECFALVAMCRRSRPAFDGSWRSDELGSDRHAHRARRRRRAASRSCDSSRPEVLTVPATRTGANWSSSDARTQLCCAACCAKASRSACSCMLRRAGAARSPTSRSSCLQTFADQAVIAIENARLFDEVQARTDDLSEVAAAADRDRRRAQGHQPLGVRSANGAGYAGRVGGATLRGRQWRCIFLREGDVFHRGGSYGFPPEFMAICRSRPVKPSGSRLRHGARIARRPHRPYPRRARRSGIRCPRAQRLSGNSRTCSACRCCAKAASIGVLALTAIRRAAVHRQADRAGADLRRPGGDRHRECAAVRRGAGAHPGTRGLARRFAHRAGSPGADRETRLARPAHRRHRPRDQEPAQFRQ